MPAARLLLLAALRFLLFSGILGLLIVVMLVIIGGTEFSIGRYWACAVGQLALFQHLLVFLALLGSPWFNHVAIANGINISNVVAGKIVLVTLLIAHLAKYLQQSLAIVTNSFFDMLRSSEV